MLMPSRFTLGIEEEFQLVQRQTGELCSCVNSILEKGAPYFEEKIKPEMLQSTIELISDVLPDIATARKNLYTQRALLARLVDQEGLVLVSAGTHPTAYWRDQEGTEKDRYSVIEGKFQDVGRSIFMFWLPVHVCVEDKELTGMLMKQRRILVPHLLAISA